MAALTALTDGPQILVGSSMGGWISLLCARAMPDRLAGLVTIAAAPDFTEDSIDALADLSAEINSSVENIGARRLHTVLEKLLEEISFTATDRSGETITIDAALVQERVGELSKNADLSKFIL